MLLTRINGSLVIRWADHYQDPTHSTSLPALASISYTPQASTGNLFLSHPMGFAWIPPHLSIHFHICNSWANWSQEASCFLFCKHWWRHLYLAASVSCSFTARQNTTFMSWRCPLEIANLPLNPPSCREECAMLNIGSRPNLASMKQEPMLFYQIWRKIAQRCKNRVFSRNVCSQINNAQTRREVGMAWDMKWSVNGNRHAMCTHGQPYYHWWKKSCTTWDARNPVSSEIGLLINWCGISPINSMTAYILFSYLELEILISFTVYNVNTF